MPLRNVLVQLARKREIRVGPGLAGTTRNLSGLAVRTAVMVLAPLPVAVLSPLVQKHVKKGVLTGAAQG